MVWLLVAVGAVTAAVLLALVVTLFKHLRGLTASIEGLRSELTPLVEDIRRGSEAAQRRVSEMQDRAAALRREPG
jgi:hypothetical protein